MQIVGSTDKKQATEKAASHLHSYLLDTADRPTLLLCSGGSSLAVLAYLTDRALRPNLFLGLIDERWTSEESGSNLSALKALPFVLYAQKKGVPIVGIEVVGSVSPEASATQYEGYLKQWRSTFQTGVIIAVLGVGSDGHVAGILPYPEEKNWFDETFLKTHKWVVGYDTKGKGDFSGRVSVSLHFLVQEVDVAIVYACGEEKRLALERVVYVSGSIAEVPARVLPLMKEVHLFTDTDSL